MSVLATLQARWHGTSAREQRLLLIAAAVVGLALLWWVGLAPALNRLTTADQQRGALDAQWLQMQELQVQAKALQAKPLLSATDARRMLDASVAPLGTAVQLADAGDQVRVTVKGLSPEALAQWLSTARQNARAVPSEAKLVRNAAGTWDGSLVLSLNAR
jgi:general secretion pathway protein M